MTPEQILLGNWIERIVLDNDDTAELMRPIVGQGGWQRLLGQLQALLGQATGDMNLSDEERDCICRYAFDYGNGGWENRLRQIFGRHLGKMRNG